MKFLYSIVLVALAFAGAHADTYAQQACKNLHHVDIDESGTQYTNGNCLLICNVHGHLYNHPVNEGLSCSLGLVGVC